MSVTVTPDPAYPAGHALIRVAGAGAHVGSPAFRLQRDAGWGDDKLGPDGWQSSDVLLMPAQAERSGADLLLRVGWDVCRHLEAGVYELSVPAAGVGPAGVFWPDIAPQHAGSAGLVRPPEPPVPPAPPPMPEPVAPTPVAPKPVPPTPSPAPPAKPQLVADDATVIMEPPPPLPPVLSGGGGVAVAVGLLLLLLVLAGLGGGYYYLSQPSSPQVATAPQAPVEPRPQPERQPTPPEPRQPPPTPPEQQPSAPPAPPSLSGLSVPDVIARAPDPAAIRAEGERRLADGRKDDGLLLLEAAADRADAGAAAAIGALYDPAARPPRVLPADARQAARYYRDAARGGANVSAARDALRRRLQDRAGGGDLAADLMLKDFWP